MEAFMQDRVELLRAELPRAEWLPAERWLPAEWLPVEGWLPAEQFPADWVPELAPENGIDNMTAAEDANAEARYQELRNASIYDENALQDETRGPAWVENRRREEGDKRVKSVGESQTWSAYHHQDQLEADRERRARLAPRLTPEELARREREDDRWDRRCRRAQRVHMAREERAIEVSWARGHAAAEAAAAAIDSDDFDSNEDSDDNDGYGRDGGSWD